MSACFAKFTITLDFTPDADQSDDAIFALSDALEDRDFQNELGRCAARLVMGLPLLVTIDD